MLLLEAATRARVTEQPLLGRPTCMAIPAVMPGGVASSLGCIGNRVYTGLPDDELYVAVADELGVVAAANAGLAEHHQMRRETVRTSHP